MAWLIWLVVGVVLLAVEATTLSFVLVYFGVGALLASLTARLDAPLWAQGAEFVIVSLALMLLTRPTLMRLARNTPLVETNVSALPGKTGIVTIAIDNDASTGQIRIGTEIWTARAVDDDGEPIAIGAKVRIVEVTGVTARVRALELKAPPLPAATQPPPAAADPAPETAAEPAVDDPSVPKGPTDDS